MLSIYKRLCKPQRKFVLMLEREYDVEVDIRNTTVRLRHNGKTHFMKPHAQHWSSMYEKKAYRDLELKK